MKRWMVLIAAAWLLLGTCIAGGINTQNVEQVSFNDVREQVNGNNLTDLQKTSAKKKFIGRSVAWQGWIENVVEASGGKYRCLVDFDAPTELFSLSDCEFIVDKKTAEKMNKGQVIFIAGKIEKLRTLIGFQVVLENLVYELP